MATRQLRIDAQRTVENILETARVMLIEDPQTSTNAIADRAQVHRTTLVRYFPTREALTEELLHRSLDAIEVQIAQTGTESGDARQALRRATLAWIDEAQRWRTGRYAPIGAARGSDSPGKLRARMTALIERGQREGTLRDDLPAESLYYVWAAMTWVYNTLRADAAPDVLAEEAVTLLSA
jgi:AcrR family transcriptional regulator